MPPVPWEQKESYRWALGATHVQEVACSAATSTYVFDSEADDFKRRYYLANDLGDAFIIRTKHN